MLITSISVVDPNDKPAQPVKSYVDLPPSLSNLGESSVKKEKEKKVDHPVRRALRSS